jgi:hypothetical protein
MTDYAGGTQLNKRMLKHLESHRLRLRPLSRSCTRERYGLSALEPEFTVHSIGRQSMLLVETGSGLGLWLGFDHIRHFISDQPRNGISYGYLVLKSQVYLDSENRKSWLEPV